MALWILFSPTDASQYALLQLSARKPTSRGSCVPREIDRGMLIVLRACGGTIRG